jgi:hypothetical protein
MHRDFNVFDRSARFGVKQVSQIVGFVTIGRAANVKHNQIVNRLTGDSIFGANVSTSPSSQTHHCATIVAESVNVFEIYKIVFTIFAEIRHVKTIGVLFRVL